MVVVEDDSGLSENTPPKGELEGHGCIAGDTRFDASQYEFFGKGVMEEVELGGLEDDGDGYCFVGAQDGDSSFSVPKNVEKGECLGFSSEKNDVGNSCLMLKKDTSHPRNTVVMSERGSFSRESSFASADCSGELDLSCWPDQYSVDAEYSLDGKRWCSHPQPSPSHLGESRPLSRASSFPYEQQQQQQQQQQQNVFVEQVPLGKSASTSYPSRTGLCQDSAIISHNTNPLASNAEFVGRFPAHNVTSFSGSRPHLSDLHLGPNYVGNLPQFLPPGLTPSSNSQEEKWLRQSGIMSADTNNLLPGLFKHNLSHLNGPVQSHHGRFHNVQFSDLSAQHFGQPPSAHMMSKLEAMLGMTDLRDQGMKTGQRGMQNTRFPHQAPDVVDNKSGGRWPQFRSKYMSSDEIIGLVRMQHAATHSSDPYTDDYYHQACLAKRSSGAKLRHHFCPNSIKDLPPRSRAITEQHAFLQVDALGRIPFSSVRRPRPLLDVDSPTSSAEESNFEQKSSVKPLEQEPMLDARVTVEDGLCHLIDVDDIDRFLQFSPQQDTDSQLKRKRQVYLEQIAASLQLVDPLDPDKAGQSVSIAPKDDIFFLRIVSLPKGRKLLSRYLLLLHPGNVLARIVCMAIFRHLRFLFGGLPADGEASETTSILAASVSSCVRGMDLGSLSACLAAVVCSSEQPPLRPIGSSAGYGASVIVQSVIERATEILKDDNAVGSYSIRNRALWQESFNAFFELLFRYCSTKYESIAKSLVINSEDCSVGVREEATRAIRNEMPVELLRASLPHTDEQQRKLLLELARRAMPVG
ncbi:hypothetical protein HPP92_001999 [Vanilla planifolia]|uniref:mRNA decay factor PAT1 domain-containing protein n=1 Tax=Vanilla planifolia TaxID=51239 RepID=A0A835SCZ4_VANPL|nr:hypothetical protein HPP92_001999 [Vanilla planifolia]